MTALPMTAVARPIIPQKSKLRLLIISDEPKHMKSLQTELDHGEVVITNVSRAEEVQNVCCGGHDLAVIDVAPGKVIDVLETLRSSAGYSDISVLVDNSRLMGEPSLAGVLPSYRAMPCNSTDLVRLARRRVTNLSSTFDSRPSQGSRML